MESSPFGKPVSQEQLDARKKQGIHDPKKAEAMALASDPERSKARELREIAKGDLDYGLEPEKHRTTLEYKPVDQVKQDAADRAKVEDREADRREEAAGKSFDEAKRQEK
ncbi:MAG: hypothetical protein WC783_01285, partial [Candidatus Paceibacterota bacterium]